MVHYPATYIDARGQEAVSIANDGETLRVTIRGVNFAGRDFDSLEPTSDATPVQLAQFSLCHGELCSCRLEWLQPVPVFNRGRRADGVLRIELTLGDPAPKGGLDRVELRIALEYDGGRFAGTGRSGWFEDELLEVQAQLPDGVYFLACINCLYSDYSPAGHGLFGSMMCYRNVKAEYLKVKSKADFWKVHGRLDRHVQETYLCPEFERRVPGTGYRG